MGPVKRRADEEGEDTVNELKKSARYAPVSTSDGFSDVDDEGFGGLIENPPKVKFTNEATWMRGEEVISPDREFFVIGILRVVQRWINQLPAEGSRVLEPDEPWPDVEKLNKAAPPEEWRDYFGKRVGPWQKSYVVYLLDPRSTEVFTYPTSTGGGITAVRQLRKSIARARQIRGPDVYPLVTLSNIYGSNNFGGRRYPRFIFKDCRPLSEKSAPAQIEHHDDHGEHDDRRHDRVEGVKLKSTDRGESKPPKRESLKHDLDDEIPW
jgi:hypothetical protein